MSEDPAVLVYCTCPDEQVGQDLAQALVGEKLAACVSLVSGIRSVYRWQDKVEQDMECLLMIKSRQSRFAALRARILEGHPYELPEILAVPVTHGHPPYLNWIAEATG